MNPFKVPPPPKFNIFVEVMIVLIIFFAIMWAIIEFAPGNWSNFTNPCHCEGR